MLLRDQEDEHFSKMEVIVGLDGTDLEAGIGMKILRRWQGTGRRNKSKWAKGEKAGVQFYAATPLFMLISF